MCTPGSVYVSTLLHTKFGLCSAGDTKSKFMYFQGLPAVLLMVMSQANVTSHHYKDDNYKYNNSNEVQSDQHLKKEQ